jgi:hypothetical protein
MSQDYLPLANVTLASATSSVTFSSIPATYRDLVLVFNGSFTATANSFWQANGDTGANYSYIQAFGTGSGGGSSDNGNSALAGANYTDRGTNILQFIDYSATDKHKVALTRSNSASGAVAMASSRWFNTAAITSVRVFLSGQNFTTGSTFALYGIVG